MNHSYFWLRCKGIYSCLPGPKVTVIHDSYFWALIPPLNFIIHGGCGHLRNCSLRAWGYSGVCVGIGLTQQRVRARLTGGLTDVWMGRVNQIGWSSAHFLMGKVWIVQGVPTARWPGLGWLGFWVLHCLPYSAWADGNWAEACWASGQNHRIIVNPASVHEQMGHPVAGKEMFRLWMQKIAILLSIPEWAHFCTLQKPMEASDMGPGGT